VLTTSETVQLPDDDPEAIAFLKRDDTKPGSDPLSQTPTSTAGPSKKPPRRKPRQSLEAMSAALDKGKKMTTLEKVSQTRCRELICSLKWTGRTTRARTRP